MARKSDRASRPSQRVLRMSELVRHALADMFTRGDIQDPVIEKHTITIPEVVMTPDLRHATAYVMPLGGKDARPVLDALNRHKKFMRGQLAKKIEAKFMPELHFRLDERFERAEKIDKLLRRPEVLRDLKKGGDE